MCRLRKIAVGQIGVGKITRVKIKLSGVNNAAQIGSQSDILPFQLFTERKIAAGNISAVKFGGGKVKGGRIFDEIMKRGKGS